MQQALRMNKQKMERVRILILTQMVSAHYPTLLPSLIEKMFAHYPSHDELNVN